MITKIRVGKASVTLFNGGDIEADLADWFRLPRALVARVREDILARPIRVPVQCVHITLPETVVLVDAPRYEAPPRSGPAMEGYTPPPDILAQLAAAGLSPEAIEHVVITHAHYDHYSGVAIRQGKTYQPAFVSAHYYISRLDWEQRSLQRALRRRNSADSHTFGVLQANRKLVLVDSLYEIAAGVTIVPAAGETPGHQVVRVQSDGFTLYCLGDLYHHVVEVEQPEWVAHWNDHAATLASRAAFVEAALAEEALLAATHIPGFGRLVREGASLRWRTVGNL